MISGYQRNFQCRTKFIKSDGKTTNKLYLIDIKMCFVKKHGKKQRDFFVLSRKEDLPTTLMQILSNIFYIIRSKTQ